MHTTTLLGLEILFLAVGLTIGLVLWCRHIIETIHWRDLKSLRQIRKELGNGQ